MPDPFGLTPREAQVAELVALGATTKQIAWMLSVSLHTVKNQVSAIFDKTGCTGRVACALAWRAYCPEPDGEIAAAYRDHQKVGFPLETWRATPRRRDAWRPPAPARRTRAEVARQAHERAQARARLRDLVPSADIHDILHGHFTPPSDDKLPYRD